MRYSNDFDPSNSSSLKKDKKTTTAITKNHRFWKSCVGSVLRLLTDEEYLELQVFTITPKLFKISHIITSSNDKDVFGYCWKKQALKIIDDWIEYNKQKSLQSLGYPSPLIYRVEFIETFPIDMSKLLLKTSTSDLVLKNSGVKSPKSPTSCDSPKSPKTPKSSWWRRTNSSSSPSPPLSPLSPSPPSSPSSPSPPSSPLSPLSSPLSPLSSPLSPTSPLSSTDSSPRTSDSLRDSSSFSSSSSDEAKETIVFNKIIKKTLDNIVCV